MWAALDYSGDPVYWNPDWLDVVRWATRQGGDLDVVFNPYIRPGESVKADGDIDLHGDLT